MHLSFLSHQAAHQIQDQTRRKNGLFGYSPFPHNYLPHLTVADKVAVGGYIPKPSSFKGDPATTSLTPRSGPCKTMLLILHILVGLSIAALSSAQFQPSEVPLLVRTPYFSSWVSRNIFDDSPKFWNGDNVTLGGFIKVDGTPYEWMGTAWKDGGLADRAGMNFSFVEVDDISVTPTRTVYSVSAGPMRLNFTFLSPVESFPFGYIYVDAISGDGGSHDVQLYCDITGEWLSDDRKDDITWENVTSDSMFFHKIQLKSDNKPATNMAHDGLLYFATQPDSNSNMTWNSGGQMARRSFFFKNSALSNTQDPNLRCINCGDPPVFAFANDLGDITSTSQPVVWAIGYVRNPVITRTGQQLKPYWTTAYSRIEDGMLAFLKDFSDAKARAETFDEKIVSEAGKVSSDYAGLVSLSTRQVFGSVEIAIDPANGPLMFMKDVGTSLRVNLVSTIFASFPAYIYINSTWARYLLEPLLQNRQLSTDTSRYAPSDLGDSYPEVPGGTYNLARTIEDSGSMLIMTWAHAKFSGSQTLLSTYYQTLREWTENLIAANAVTPSGYEDADGLSTANLTNLALKGIIGVRAMADISYTLGKGDDAAKYQTQASRWIEQWKAMARDGSDGHLLSAYNLSGSWGMIYNLFADKWLGMNLVDPEIYEAQDVSYGRQLQSSGNEFGIPFDYSSYCGLSGGLDWTMFTAATTNSSVRGKLLQSVYDKASDIDQRVAFASTYDTRTRNATGRANPALGAAFAILAMDMSGALGGLPSNSVAGSSGIKSVASTIAGGIVGGIVGVACIALGLLFWRRQKKTYLARDFQQTGGIMDKFFGRGRANDQPEDGHPSVSPYTHWSIATPSVNTQNSHPQDAHQTGTSGSRKKDLASSSRSPFSTEITSLGDTVTSPPAPSSTRPSSRSAGSDMSALRNEVERLRQNMAEIRSRTNYEPPPSYN
ncbi:hypothetical protein VNI00_007603 [Paramarasmius palmivorus]|uniref:DUF1793-domain-containing protein n=1 Tax=Paramarasmius palmivorus TaxID=297713 RepID=A0AAW0D385_9AGAR